MYVRAYDKNNDRYFKSIVYAKVNSGCYLQYVVLNPFTEAFELVDYMEGFPPVRYFIDIIQPDCTGFKLYKDASLLKHKHSGLFNRIDFSKITQLEGYPDVCENYKFIADIIKNKSVPVSKYSITLRSLEDTSKWNYILTQDDANAFMKLFAGFHDSTLDKVSYTETDDYVSATVTFDNSCWYGVVELCFEAVQKIQIVPSVSIFMRQIFDASLIVENESIFWADEYMEQIDTSYEYNYIKALSLKWRKT